MGIRRALLVIGLPLIAALTAITALTVGWGAHGAGAQSTPTLALDMDPTNGSGPCNPIDNGRPVNVGEEFKVAVCLSNVPSPPGDFQFDIHYNDDFNQCVSSECSGEGCLDSNPDANAGSTTFGDSSLGASWDCNIMGVQPPACDSDPGSGKGHGDAHMVCMSLEELTLKTGEGVSSAIAMVTFKSIAEGTDTMTLEEVEVDDVSVEKIVDPAAGYGAVIGGSVSTEGVPPTLTPGATATTGPSPTPNPILATVTAAAVETAVAQGTPLAAINSAATAAASAGANATSAAVATKAAAGAAKTPTSKATAKPASTSEESDGSSGPNALLIAGIAVGAVIVVGGAGFFGYRLLRAR